MSYRAAVTVVGLPLLLATLLVLFGVREIVTINVTQSDELFRSRDEAAACPERSICVPLLQCPFVDRMAIVEYLSRPAVLRVPPERRWQRAHWRRCQLDEDKFAGICCNSLVADTLPTVAEPEPLPHTREDEVLQKAQEAAMRKLNRFRLNSEQDLANKSLPGQLFHGSPGHGAVPEAVVWQGLHDVLTLQALRRMSNGTVTLDIRRSKRCLVGPPCERTRSRYRSLDGRCNNIEPGRSRWGSVGYPMERVLAPLYDDGVWAPRVKSITGRYLPSARELSGTLFTDLYRAHSRHNVLLMQFGQFLAHDFSRNQALPGTRKCCTADGSARLKNASFGCMPIAVRQGDDFYSQHGVQCLHFTRTAVAPMDECDSKYARQLSSVSHFIDGSPIYGNSKQEAHDLRAHEGGRLKSIEHRRYHNELPPLDRTEGACEKWAEMCFKTGDVRSNQLITLVAVHTLFLREHNRIARQFERLNPHWSDDTIFKETRRIVIAQLQHIAFAEYLPKIVGHRLAAVYKLHPAGGDLGYTSHYRPDVNPSVTSEFTVAAFRFGHSTVPSKLDLKGRSVETWHLFLDPTRFRERTFYDELFHSMQRQPMQAVDDQFSTSVTRFLDVVPGTNHGKDLAAINIQRGRDHALRPYNDYRRLIGRPAVRDFAEFGPNHGPTLAALYASVDDVDLYVGAILEPPIEDGVVGETFAEIISDQFARFQHGDRYFYSNGPDTNPGHFTQAQLREIQRITMASLICANAGETHRMYVLPDAFSVPDEGNRPVVCSSPDMSHLDLKWWKD
ncbi:chorion peroxidase-like isoform X1 [Anopheles albimanus]|uniref:chorion peroxidase-like isoform X1 n=1 Tax=Anopheles albimanus TaxID=7167 RepID=UPI00164019F4|nr:chorion peroxidase-like isoform X1 [Anopheles albimanus]